MVIPEQMLADMIAHARSEYPNECCGLLAAQGDTALARYPIANADASPVHYTMEPREQLRAMMEIDAREWEVGAIYHSHTHTRAYPSPTDIKLALYPDARYIIVSLADETQPDVRAFRITDGVVSEEAIEVAASSE